jgi:choice-of-anchor C domain-containing protein
MRATVLSLALVALTASLLGAVSPRKRGNLLVNGSFEEGPAVTNYLPINARSTQIKGWVVTRGQIDLVAGRWKAAHGGRCLDLHGSPGKGGISQTFPTRPGRTYVVTFALAGNPEGGQRVKGLGVSAAGKSATFTFDTRGKTVNNLGWATTTWRFKATSSQTTLEFSSVTRGADAYCGPALDNVSVTEE